MDEINLMRSFIEACQTLTEEDDLVNVILPSKEPMDYDIRTELDTLKFKLMTHDCGESGDLALGFDRGMAFASQLVDILINKLGTNHDQN